MAEEMSDLAGVSSDHVRPDENRSPDTATEVFPIRLEKNFTDLDFVPRAEREPEEGTLVPKSSSAPVSVAQPSSPTGLEDVSSDDLENPVQASVEKDKNQKITVPDVPTPTPSSKES